MLALATLAIAFGDGPAIAAPPPPPVVPPVFPLVQRWSVDIPAPLVAAAPPVGDADRIYLTLTTGDIVARNASDGAPVWRRELPTDRALAIDGALLFAADGDGLTALRTSDGAVAWEAAVPGVSAPMLARAGWLIVAAGGKVFAYRNADGSLVWQRAVGAVSKRPAIDGDRLYVPLTDGRIAALDVRTGAPVWEQRLPGAPGDLVATPDRVYGGAADRKFYCVSTKDGEVLWAWRVGASVEAHAAVDLDQVYFVGLDNVLRALDRRTGVQHWQHGLPRRTEAGPVVLHDRVLVPSGSSNEVWAWTADGTAAGTVTAASELASAPLIIDERQDGARVYLVTGSLAQNWKLAELATAGDPAFVPLPSVPGDALPRLGLPSEIPLTPLTALPGTPVPVRAPGAPPAPGA